MSATFLIGGMLGRIAGPIAQEWFKHCTPMGKSLAKKADEEKARMQQRELESKLQLSAQEHKARLEQLEKQYQDSRKRAEEQMFLARQEWQQKQFWERCFPLRNPYEMPLGYDPIFDESHARITGCKLKTVIGPNNRQIVPLRIITAIKDSTHPAASTLNSELSMFIANYYEANGSHAVLSDIGSWRDDAPINDASINFLYTGAKGLPSMVIVPFFTNGGSMLRLKVWSWGLGEEYAYPQAFDFAWVDLDELKRHALFSELKTFKEVLEKTGISLPADAKKLDIALKKITLLEKHRGNVSPDEFTRLLTLVDSPEEIKLNVDRHVNNCICAVASCLVAMQADNYHLSEFGTHPQLPFIIDKLPSIPFMYDAIAAFYSSIINAARIEGLIPQSEAINLEMTLCEAVHAKSPGHPCLSPLVNEIRLLNSSNDIEHNQFVRRLRAITQSDAKLLLG